MRSYQNTYFSLFATNPDVQAKYFGHMKKDADLEKHGVRVFNAIGAMVTACENEDDGKLVKKIHEVLNQIILIILNYLIDIENCISMYFIFGGEE